MKDRVSSDLSLLNEARAWLPKVRAFAEVETSALAFVHVLDEYIDRKYKGWLHSLENPTPDDDDADQTSAKDSQQSLTKRLDNNLMARQQQQQMRDADDALRERAAEGFSEQLKRNRTSGRLENNFDHTLLSLFSEVRLWDTFEGRAIPYTAHDLANNQNERLRQIREHVMIVVRGYNDVIDALDERERRLFTDHIRIMDRRIQPGIMRLNWMDKRIKEWFVPTCSVATIDAMKVVESYKKGMTLIDVTCRDIERTQLVLIEKNTVYEEGEFEAKQKSHREVVTRTLLKAQQTIKDTIESLRPSFADSKSPDVRREWQYLVKTIDRRVESSLRLTAKRSLQDMSRAINGDNRSEPQPLFKVSVVLDKVTQKIELSPTIITLTQMVNVISKKLLMVLKKIPRIYDPNTVRLGFRSSSASQEAVPAAEAEAEAVSRGAGAADGDAAAAAAAAEEDAAAAAAAVVVAAPSKSPLKSFYDVVSEDEDVLKVLVNIMNGMSSSGSQLNKVLAYWDKYRLLWEMDREAFIRRYAKANRPLSQFEIDISRYRDQQFEIEQEEVSDNKTFIRVDYSELKAKLVTYALDWQLRLTSLLNQVAKTELDDLIGTMKTASDNLQATARNLDELGDKINTMDSFSEGSETAAEFAARFEPLEAKYATLIKFDVVVPDAELALLTSLRPSQSAFKGVLFEAKKTLTKAKAGFRESLVNTLGSFTMGMSEGRKSAVKALPFHDAELTPQEALAKVQAQREAVIETRKELDRLGPGLAIFGLETPSVKNIEDTEKDLALLEAIWGVAQSFDENWVVWKEGKFKDLDVENMNTMALQYRKQVGKLKRDIKKWKVFGAVQNRIDQFLKTLPLIQDLRNKAMRTRHWDSLREEMKKEFDPNSDEFTLERVFTLGVNLHAEFIGDLSATANKELGIEAALKEMGEIWEEVTIEMTTHKEVYYKIRDVEDLFAQLEDHQVSVSTMKASRFYQSFKESIDHWEGSLAHISEVIELALTVQRQWMYLESIFMASEDIRKQLPKESQLFDEVNNTYILMTKQMYRDPNAMRACSAEGLLETLMDSDEKLQVIQKQLDAYLETKRMVFPRFYFLSNDDLLEILGQQKDPKQVQKHIKKCFVGIKRLQLIDPHTPGVNNLTIEAVGMVSPDGEELLANENVVVDGPVELWLILVEEMMRSAVRKWLRDSVMAFKATKKKEKWVKMYHGQLLITTGAIMWTADCARALNQIANGKKKAMRHLKKQQARYVVKLAAMVRGKLTRIERKKVVALITMEIHSRDTQDKMIKADCGSVNDFEWLMQLRYIFHKDDPDHPEFGNTTVHSTNAQLEYSYEYQGNNGRLVVTPLTDRCILTMVNALYLCRGGNPLGPAGTGKTETVKDMGKNLAKYVIVINCSDGLDYKSVGRMFAGLVQSGGWGCFDEFNRIEIEVLSVVAQQILTIMAALSGKKSHFDFEGTIIKCNPSMGIFITMNPGYAGRTELPDNLKALMRPCAMMVPDLALIAEVMLAANGFEESKSLSKKTTTLYALMIQQLTKQDHYDYGLRSLKAVLNAAGALKRSDPDMAEEAILLRALRDMNVPKFITDDLRLFKLLLGDLFPDLELPDPDYGVLQTAIERSLRRGLEGIAGGIPLQTTPFIVGKTIQLFESMAMRHCNMMVGLTLSGKSTAWRCLAAARTAMCKEDKMKEYQPVRPIILNPKSLNLNEIYGAYDLATFEWMDGVLSSLFRDAAADERPIDKWIVLDGPVDTLWIESMNSVMDDNKVLTLINSDRIEMSASMSLLFEVRDLSVASPATVSRAGMVFMDRANLGPGPYISSWLQNYFSDGGINAEGSGGATEDASGGEGKSGDGKEGGEAAEGDSDKAFLAGLFEKYVTPMIEAKDSDGVEELVPISAFNGVQSFCQLFEAFCRDSSTGISKEHRFQEMADDSVYQAYVERWFCFCVVWSLLAAADRKSRKRLDYLMRDIDSTFPAANTIYDYWVDPKSGEFKPWSDRVSSSYQPPASMPFYKIVVPTIDTVRNQTVMDVLVKNKRNTLIVGNTGTGKTILAAQLLSKLPRETHANLLVNFSSATTSNATQDIIESVMEKRSKVKFGPQGGKKLITFVDDLNMPTKDEFGSQPPLELLRQWIDYSCWYDRQKQSLRYILDMQLLCAMGPPGGGRSVISQRLQSRFHVLNFATPEQAQLRRIFECILGSRVLNTSVDEPAFDDEIKSMVGNIVLSTVGLYQHVSEGFLPTPTKPVYIFNMRDMAKVIEGLLRAKSSNFVSAEAYLQLWVHESQRVFSDRLNTLADKERFNQMVDDQLQSNLGSSWSAIVPDPEAPGAGPVVTDILSDPAGDSDATHGTDISVVENFDRLKATVLEDLEEYNMEPGLIPMNLVLFKDALGHMMRIQRVLRTPRGNAMLIGVGGSGRQSQTRLASFICNMSVFSIEITKNYRSIEFREDLKRLFNLAGVENKPTVFLFSDTQIKEEGFLEDVNNLLSSGIVPGLFTDDELAPLRDSVASLAKKQGLDQTPDVLWGLFVERVRANMHIVVCMSPVGDDFTRRIRMFPGLVSCTTIDWFLDWPVDALVEVGSKFLEEEHNLENAEVKEQLSQAFGYAHASAVTATAQMKSELNRHNYVTPTSFLELVKGYRALLGEKRGELLASADKLRNGVVKLVEARDEVETMSAELEIKKIQVDKAQKDCEEMLVGIVNDKRTADEKRKHVEAEAERIGREESETKAIAEDAERDLSVALPALEKAMSEVDKLQKGDISEVKAYKTPPGAVVTTMAAVMTLFKGKTDWASGKSKLMEVDFLTQIKTFDKDSVSNGTLSKVKKFTNKPDFNPTKVGGVSKAAGALCTWVCAVRLYCEVFRTVAPKKAALKKAMSSLALKQAALAKSKAELQEVSEKVAALQAKFDKSVGEKNALRDEAEKLEAYLQRAQDLVSGLAGERDRWEKSIGGFELDAVNVVGDAFVAAAFLSYAGVFETNYRGQLVKGWMEQVKSRKIPISDKFSFSNFLARPTDVRGWNIQGLPKDNFSTENGVLVTRGKRWPLMIDPQRQANKWVKKMAAEESGGDLKVIDLKMDGFLRVVETCISFGFPLLLQDIEETLDPSLEPVLGKQTIKRGNQTLIRVGDKELDFSPDFKFYLTTRLANPHYAPEVCTKVTLVNFVVKEQGLEAQLLGIVVGLEEPQLEEQGREVVIEVAKGKKQLLELEDGILQGLQNATGSLLDDEELVKTLQQSKITSDAVKERLIVAESTEKMIAEERKKLKPVSIKASVLYFVLNDLASVNPMYQTALDAYTDLFKLSIKNSKKSGGGSGGGGDDGGGLGGMGGMGGDGTGGESSRLDNINAYHMEAVYRSTCRGLFERHKLLFSFQMTIRLQQNVGSVPKDEYDMFLKGPVVLDRGLQRPNPCPDWLPESAWDGITELDKNLAAFQGLAAAFEQSPKEWRQYYNSDTAEIEVLPGEWEGKVSDLQRLCVLRMLRPDRLLVGITKYVSIHMGQQFVDPPAFDLDAIYRTSSHKSPLIFVLSPGVDPTNTLLELAATKNVQVGNCALGQGQAPKAEALLDEGCGSGKWVFLSNCHLMLSWMPVLEKRIEAIGDGTTRTNAAFRLWLSTNPDPKFPIMILQCGVKMTTEPPSGLRANLTRMINLVSAERFERCEKKSKYKPLLFCLCWFHSLLIERRKFRNLGFNIPYEFNESDFLISEDVLGIYIDAYEKTPWDALQYLIADANYGGRITDDFDRRLVRVYIAQFFNSDSLAVQQYPLSELKAYHVPSGASLDGFKQFIKGLPMDDDPRAFGQHPNAAIASQISESTDMLATLLSLGGGGGGGGGDGKKKKDDKEEAAPATDDDVVLAIASDLDHQAPKPFDIKEITEALKTRSDPDPIVTVLMQEIDRYNILLVTISRTLKALQLGIQGLVVITPELEDIFAGILNAQVPGAWAFAYPSLKPLAAWMRDLTQRCEQIEKWGNVAIPKTFWFTGFTYPTGFLTALMQTCARKSGEAIDSLSWEFVIVPQDPSSISQHPKDGAYMHGMFLEGARWDYEHGSLTEPSPMELFSDMPIIHFKPTLAKKKIPRGTYQCPTYMYPFRSGSRERPSFVIEVNLKCGVFSSEFWVKRGTALLLALAT
jgi:dynein heavy chain